MPIHAEITLAAIIVQDRNIGSILEGVPPAISDNGRGAEYERMKCLLSTRVGSRACCGTPEIRRTRRAYELVMDDLDRRLDGKAVASA